MEWQNNQSNKRMDQKGEYKSRHKWMRKQIKSELFKKLMFD